MGAVAAGDREAVRANALTAEPDGSQSDDPVTDSPTFTATAGAAAVNHGDQPSWLPVGLKGLLEPDAASAARPVLRGVRRSNAPLPDSTRPPTLPCAAPTCTDVCRNSY